MSYSIKIVDNDNGEVIFDSTEAIACIGAVADTNGAHGLALTDCDFFKLITTIIAAKKSISDLEDATPAIQDFAKYFEELKSFGK